MLIGAQQPLMIQTIRRPPYISPSNDSLVKKVHLDLILPSAPFVFEANWLNLGLKDLDTKDLDFGIPSVTQMHLALYLADFVIHIPF